MRTVGPNQKIITPIVSEWGSPPIDKNAKNPGSAYKRDRFQLSHTWLLGGGQFLINHVGLHLDRYDASDAPVSAKRRRDEVFRYRLTYGAPLGFLLGSGWLPRMLEDVTLTAEVERFRANSNIPNFDYGNWKAQALLTKTWRF